MVPALVVDLPEGELADVRVGLDIDLGKGPIDVEKAILRIGHPLHRGAGHSLGIDHPVADDDALDEEVAFER
ncbi:hypothetical protein D3C86_2198960 [compost metagenome]